MRVLIAGGGIGGVTLTLSLHRLGIPCTLFEAAEETKELGVGINSLPHATRELATLGMLPELDRLAIRTRELRYLNHRGQELWAEPRGLWAGHDMPQLSIHRGQLLGALWRAAKARLPDDTLRNGHRLCDFHQDGTGLTARFVLPDGTRVEERGTVLIGADGIHSVMRNLLHPKEDDIRWNGVQMWRGAVDWPAYKGGDVMFVAGDLEAKLVFYPIAKGTTSSTRLTNWMIYARISNDGAPPLRREDWSRQGKVEEVLRFARRMQLPFLDVEALVRATPRCFEYPMCDRDPLPWWTQGRVTLIGDAAHPMYPVGSNGAAQAILDASCLATLLFDLPPEEALRVYETKRLAVTTEIVRSNRTGGPERVVDVVAERAPDGFDRLEDVVTVSELATIVNGYAKKAGFAVNRKSIVPNPDTTEPPQ